LGEIEMREGRGEEGRGKERRGESAPQYR